MRKDVKFGLTVGAILVATLIVYVIVLSGGGLSSTAKQDSRTLAVNTGDTPAPAAQPPADSSAAPAPRADDTMSSALPAPATVAPTPADMNSATTQPQASAQSSSNDWDYRLNHAAADLPGPRSEILDQPQRTETPVIDSGNTNLPPHPIVVATGTPEPTIDSIIPLMAAPANLPAQVDVPMTQPTQMMINGADPATPTVMGQRTHRIASGESLWTIAQSVYGNGSYFTKIVAANPDLNPKELKIGKILIIPDLTATEKQPSATPAADSTKAAAPINPETNYRVVSGDTLEKIARKLYNDTNMQDKIFTANKALMGDNPDKLKVGWVLVLPKAPTVSLTADASH